MSQSIHQRKRGGIWLRSVSPLFCEKEENLDPQDFVRSLSVEEQRVRNTQLQKLSIANRWLQSFANSQSKRGTAISEEVKEAIGCIAEVLRYGRVW